MTDIEEIQRAIMIREFETRIRELQELLRNSIQQNADRDVLLQSKEEQIQTLIGMVNDLRQMLERSLGRSLIQ